MLGSCPWVVSERKESESEGTLTERSWKDRWGNGY